MTSPARQPLALGAILTLVALALVLLLSRGHGAHTPAASPLAAPSAPLILNAGHPAPTPATSAPTTQAQAVARAFLASYLPVLYGRRPPSTITVADAHVRRSLETALRSLRARANRHPRVSALAGEQQANGSVVEVATIADGVSPPYRIVFLVAQQRGAWQVTQLANF